ncbi:hypothetical protein ACU4GR_01170 [Methylobacterium oryzae CBMB20]
MPVLAGSAAYALAEAFQWSEGLDRRLEAGQGLLRDALGGDLGRCGPQLHRASIRSRLLYWAAVVNGILARHRSWPR